MTVTIAGDGFGTARPVPCCLERDRGDHVQSWTNTSVTVTVPSVTAGTYSVTVKNSGGTQSNGIQLQRPDSEADPRYVHSKQCPADECRRLHLRHRQCSGAWELGNHLPDRQLGPMLDPKLPKLVPQCVLARRNDGAIQIHRHPGERQRYLGAGQQPLVHRARRAARPAVNDNW